MEAWIEDRIYGGLNNTRQTCIMCIETLFHIVQ